MHNARCNQHIRVCVPMMQLSYFQESCLTCLSLVEQSQAPLPPSLHTHTNIADQQRARSLTAPHSFHKTSKRDGRCSSISRYSFLLLGYHENCDTLLFHLSNFRDDYCCVNQLHYTLYTQLTYILLLCIHSAPGCTVYVLIQHCDYLWRVACSANSPGRSLSLCCCLFWRAITLALSLSIPVCNVARYVCLSTFNSSYNRSVVQCSPCRHLSCHWFYLMCRGS